MTEETRIALLNYAWISEHREGSIAWEVDTLIWGDGGDPVDVLCEEGFTPATCGPDFEAWIAALRAGSDEALTKWHNAVIAGELYEPGDARAIARN